jgi:hypothetical protein
MGSSESKEPKRDWSEFTNNQGYQQNIQTTYANREEANYQTGDPQWASSHAGNNITKETEQINAVKVTFNLIETDMKLESSKLSGNLMDLVLPIYI